MQNVPSDQAKADPTTALLHLMLAGHSYPKAAEQLGGPPPLKQSCAYQPLKHLRATGVSQWPDERHGHPSTFRRPLTLFLEQLCHQAPLLSGHQIQLELEQHFEGHFSPSQINRVRRKLAACRSNQFNYHTWVSVDECNPLLVVASLSKQGFLRQAARDR